MKKIGVFGGSFDPVHYGHVYLARQALSEGGVNHVIVVPTGAQPFKLDRPVTAKEHRLNMARLAFKDEEGISVSDIEIAGNEVSYTIDTLREIRKTYGNDAEISFILGADMFLKIEKWKSPGELLGEFPFFIGVRPGFEDSELDAFISRVAKSYGAKAVKINNRRIPISSTEIKEMIKLKKSCEGVIPPDVERYIYDNGLYF